MTVGQDHNSDEELIREAREALGNAQAVSSRFSVGVALEAGSRKIYQGCNIETPTANTGICAERLALFKALSEGEKEFRAIAIVSSAGKFCPPCGICRQLLWDYAPGAEVIMVGENGQRLVKKVQELLPLPFDRSGPR